MSPWKDSLNGLPEGSQIGHTVTSRKMGLSQKRTWKGALKSPDRNSKGRTGRFQELGRCKNRLEGAPLKTWQDGRLQKGDAEEGNVFGMMAPAPKIKSRALGD